jgi:anti-sigma regulatory factor (Ser/Thr protein kinase)
LTSELVTNAVLHAAASAPVDYEIQLQVSRIASGVRVEVSDGNPNMPHLRPPGNGGRGMHIVDAVAHTWGTFSNGTGKTVWFELAR